MTDSQKDEATPLVHWTYSQEEWKNFMRWKKRKRGLVHYLLHLLGSGPKIPVATISTNNVSIGNVREFFYGNDLQLLRVNIRDAGDMNIMEIAYERNDPESFGVIATPDRVRGTQRHEIHVLVPRGRLKEAISVEEQLNKMRANNL